MGDRRWGLLPAVVAGAVLLLGPMYASAQSQTQAQPLHFDKIHDARALCPEESKNNFGKTKDRFLALPANVIDPPQTPEGWPDLQGAWSSGPYPGSANHSIEEGADPIDIAIQCQPLEKLDATRLNLLIDPMKGRIPYQPWAKAKQMELLADIYAPQKRMDVDPEVRCFPLGVPKTTLGGFELRYVPGALVFLSNKGMRIIPMDGSPHLNPDIQLFMGDSRGHWEGHTLVIETTNNRDGTWFDKHATFRSGSTRLIERITMVSQNTIYYEVTVIDPTVFTQTWKFAQTLDRQRNSRMDDPEGRERSCHEGESEENSEIERTVRAGLRGRAAGIRGYHIHVDLATGKAILPEEQKYLDESGQPVGYSFVPGVPDSALPKTKDDSASH